MNNSAIINGRGKVCFQANIPQGVREVAVAGAVTNEGAPVNARNMRVSRSKRNLALAQETPQLAERSHRDGVFYLLIGGQDDE